MNHRLQILNKHIMYYEQTNYLFCKKYKSVLHYCTLILFFLLTCVRYLILSKVIVAFLLLFNISPLFFLIFNLHCVIEMYSYSVRLPVCVNHIISLIKLHVRPFQLKFCSLSLYVVSRVSAILREKKNIVAIEIHYWRKNLAKEISETYNIVSGNIYNDSISSFIRFFFMFSGLHLIRQ